MLDNGTVVLQNGVDFLKVEPYSVSEPCPASSHGGNQIFDTNGKEDPVSIEFPGIRPEHEVSFMPACPLLGTFHKYPELRFVFLTSCQSAHVEHLHFAERVLKSSIEMSPEDSNLMNRSCRIQIPFCYTQF